MSKKIITLLLCFVLFFSFMTSTYASVADDDAQRLLGTLGIMNGDENGNLNLEREVTRAEFSKMLVNASSYKDKLSSAATSSGFSDVLSSHWAAPYIRVASDNKWIYGYSNGSFLPSNTIKLEEAATMLLRLLGYTSADTTGVYPNGQLALYDSLGLDEGISAKKGDKVTRGDCLKLFVNLLNAKTKDGRVYAQTLGYTLGADGKIDIYKAIADEMTGPYVIEKGLSDIPVDTDGYTVYKDNRAQNVSAIEKYDVVYYSDELRAIWVYDDVVTGVYESATLSGSVPASVIVGSKSYSFEETDAAVSMSVYGEFATDDVVTLLLGKDGKIVKVLDASLHYDIDPDNYLEVVQSTLEGPYIVTKSYQALGLPTSGITVIRNNAESSISEIKLYDVVYYSSVAKTAMVYSKTVSGTYKSASPSTDAPSQVTVAGGTYTVDNSEAAVALSSIGKFRPGDFVTLLLGRDDKVVGVIPMSEFANNVYGVVLGVSSELYTDENDKNYSARTVSIMSTEGETMAIEGVLNTLIEGDVVRVTYDDTVSVERMTLRSVKGKVTNKSVGELSLASTVNVLDTDMYGKNPTPLFFSRLTGVNFKDGDVKYYAVNSEGKVTDLILSDFSNDSYKYGIMISAESSQSFVSGNEDYDYSNISSTNYIYEYQIGTAFSQMSSLTEYTSTTGPCLFKYSGNNLAEVKMLRKLAGIEKYTPFGIVASGTLYLYSDDITVYTPNTNKKSDLKYSIMKLHELTENIDSYNLHAYYDNAPENGGRIRIIIATKK